MSGGSSPSTPSKSARGCRAISSDIHFTDGQMVKKGDLLFTLDKRPFQTALDQSAANLEQARANLAFAEADLARGPELVREQDHHRADLRSAHPGQAGRRSDRRRAGGGGARPSSISNSPNCARRSPAASATGGSRSAISSPAATAPTPRCSRPSSRSIRSASSSPSTKRPICATSGSPGAKAINGGPRGRRSGRAQAPRRERLQAHGRMDFVDNAIDRSSGTIRGRAVFANADWRFHARHVRPGAGAGLATLHGAAGARCRDRHRADAQIRAGRRMPTTWCG